MGVYGFTWPLTSTGASTYLTYLYDKGYSASTISTYSSAVSYFHKIHSQPDPMSSFLAREVLSGIRKLRPTNDLRLPITIPLLTRLVQALPFLSLGFHDTASFQSMFTLAFFGLLRVGELVMTHKGDTHLLSRGAVGFPPDKRSITIQFTSFKHSKPGVKHRITINSQPPPLCPVSNLLKYWHLTHSKTFESQSHPLFVDYKGSPYSRVRFCEVLQSALALVGVPSSKMIRSHSFRIGGATYAAKSGMSDSQIRYLGRWSSNAFIKYIRSI